MVVYIEINYNGTVQLTVKSDAKNILFDGAY